MANHGSEIRNQMEERLLQKKKRLDKDHGNVEEQSKLSSILHTQINFGASRREIATFARELALLQGLGVSLIRSLNILQKRSSKSALGAMIRKMRETVELGGALSTALKEYKSSFGDFFISAIEAGEQSGELPMTLNHLADYLDKLDSIQKRIKRALALPVITLVIATGVALLMFAYIIPMFADVFKEAGMELPMLTRIVIAIGTIINKFWWVMIVIIAFGVMLFYRSGRFLGLQKISDRLVLRIPIVRSITTRLITFRFARLTSTMMNAGVNILPTLRLASSSTGNSIIEDRLKRACHHIDQGKTISEALAAENAFPAMITDAISVGEEVGSVGQVLDKLAEYSERDVEDLVANLSTLLEPIMTLLMGILVLVIALALFLPYFSMNQVVAM